MSLERSIGRLIIGGFAGKEVPDAFSDLVRRGVVGGVILFKRNFDSPMEASALLAELQAMAPEPLWTAVDQEGGRVQRLGPPFPQLPPMRTLAAPGDVECARAAGQQLARELLRLGFRQDYAPVLDVDTNPDNPVIGDRSFSRDPEEVARFGVALIEGLEANGVAACAKHFPGHGDTSQDSHLELPRLEHDIGRLNHVELVPFRAAARAGVAAIMTAHVLFPALDREHPATLSERILGPILRDGLGYDGVVVSDDLEMRAVADHYGVEDAAVRAIRAGCDQLLICEHPELAERAFLALVKAVEQGSVPRDRVEQATARVARMQVRFGGARRE